MATSAEADTGYRKDQNGRLIFHGETRGQWRFPVEQDADATQEAPQVDIDFQDDTLETSDDTNRSQDGLKLLVLQAQTEKENRAAYNCATDPEYDPTRVLTDADKIELLARFRILSQIDVLDNQDATDPYDFFFF